MQCVAVRPILKNNFEDNPLERIIIQEKTFNTKEEFTRQHCLAHGDSLPHGEERYRTIVLHNLASSVKGKAIIEDFSRVFDFSMRNVTRWIWLKQSSGYDSGSVLVVLRSRELLVAAMRALSRQCWSSVFFWRIIGFPIIGFYLKPIISVFFQNRLYRFYFKTDYIGFFPKPIKSV